MQVVPEHVLLVDEDPWQVSTDWNDKNPVQALEVSGHELTLPVHDHVT